MANNPDGNTLDQNRRVLIRVAICLLILLFGAGGFLALASLKKPPAEVEDGERALKVNVLQVSTNSIAVNITGYGQARALNSVTISAEVAGQVQAIHQRLEVGEVIPKGEILFQIDTRNYSAAVAQSQAEVSQWRSALERL